jgi:hypothetical protein
MSRLVISLRIGAILWMSLYLAATAEDLVIADGGVTSATIMVADAAGTWEKRAAQDLAHYIELMSGAKPAIASPAQGDCITLILLRRDSD